MPSAHIAANSLATISDLRVFLPMSIVAARKSTLKDVADAAGVALSTASRALAGNAQVSDETRDRVEEAAREIGYRTKKRGNSVADGRRGVVGVVVAALHNSFYPYLVDRFHNELDDLGFDMVLIIDELTRDRAGRKLRSLMDQLDGVIVTTATIGSSMVSFLVESGMPTVLAIRDDLSGKATVVQSDNRNAGAEALRHLIELGHERIGFILGPLETSTSARRLAGAKAAMEENGLVFDQELLVTGGFTHDGGYSGCLQLMSHPDRPSAIMCANDVIAIGAMEAAHKLGIDVPGQLSLIGVDDIPMASWEMISLTTVRQPTGEIGSLAASLIVESIRAEGTGTSPRLHTLPTSLVKRSSTGLATRKTGTL